MKLKTGSLRRLTKLINLQATHQEKGKKNQINKIRNEKGVVTTGNAEMQRTISDYYE